MVHPSTLANTAPRVFPAVSDGFSHLDIELAHLMRRLAQCAMGAANSHTEAFNDPMPQLDWWCGVLALVSRASAQGHTGLVRPQGGTQKDPHDSADGLALLHPELPSQRSAFTAYIQGWRAAADWNAPMPPFVAATGLLIDDGWLWALPRLRQTEHRVAHRLAQRLLQPLADLPTGAVHWLERWLPTVSSSTDNRDQHAACQQALRGALTVITGGPGTGKTHTAARLIALLQRTRPADTPWLRIGLAAPTGKAAARLRQALESAWQGLSEWSGQEPEEAAFWREAWRSVSPPKTVHSMLAQRDTSARSRIVSIRGGHSNGRSPSPATGLLERGVLPLDVLLIDEASMLDLTLMDQLLEVLSPQTKLILIGDRDQLASVEAGAVMGDICEALDGRSELVPLRHSRRFSGPIGQLAAGVRQGDPNTLAELAGQLETDRQVLLEQALGPEGWGPVLPAIRDLEGKNPSDGQWGDLLSGMDRYRVLSAVRKGPWGVDTLNELIMSGLMNRGWLAQSGDWRHGTLVMVTRNDESTGLRNGDVGLIIRPGVGDAPQFAWMVGHTVHRVGVSRLPPFEPAYAMTVHKSQGSEFDRIAMVLPEHDVPVVNREWLYTGLTRARQGVDWFGAEPTLISTAGARRTVRLSGLKGCIATALGSGLASAVGGGNEKRG